MAADLASRSEIETALTKVGELLDAQGEAFAIVILGGAALNLLGVVARNHNGRGHSGNGLAWRRFAPASDL